MSEPGLERIHGINCVWHCTIWGLAAAAAARALRSPALPPRLARGAALSLAPPHSAPGPALHAPQLMGAGSRLRGAPTASANFSPRSCTAAKHTSELLRMFCIEEGWSVGWGGVHGVGCMMQPASAPRLCCLCHPLPRTSSSRTCCPAPCPAQGHHEPVAAVQRPGAALTRAWRRGARQCAGQRPVGANQAPAAGRERPGAPRVGARRRRRRRPAVQQR